MRSTAFIMGGVVGAIAMSFWNRNRSTFSGVASVPAMPNTIKNMIQKNPELQKEVNHICEENHLPSI
jgi:hypothetical protein